MCKAVRRHLSRRIQRYARAGVPGYKPRMRKQLLRDLRDFARRTEPAPISLYFARLWYYKRLYSLVFAVSALRQFLVRGKGPFLRPNEFNLVRI